MENLRIDNLRENKDQIISLLRRFHMILFIILVVFVLMIAVILLNGIVLKSGSNTPTPISNKSRFDQSTIDRIKQLKTSDEPGTPLDFSKGRISPFSE